MIGRSIRQWKASICPNMCFIYEIFDNFADTWKLTQSKSGWYFAGNNYLYKMNGIIFNFIVHLIVIQLFITLSLAKVFFKEEFADGGKFLFRSPFWPEYISVGFCFRSYTKLAKNIDLINTYTQSIYKSVMFYFIILFQSYSSMIHCFF